jgi:glycosyltransferase involved in cell wall biosynthesis
MRILFVQQASNWGGSVRSLYWLASSLAREHDVHLAYFGEPVFAKEFHEAGIKLHRIRELTFEASPVFAAASRIPLRRGLPTLLALPRLVGDTVPTARGLASMVRRLRPDLLHTNESLRVNRAEILGGALAGVPIVAHLRGVHRLSLADRLVARRVAHFIAVSEASRRAYLDGAIDEGRISVVNNAIQLPALLTENDRDDARREFGLVGGCWIATAGRLIPRKGNHEAIEAIRLLRARGLDARLLVLGEGPEEANLRSHAEQAGVGAAVRVAGWRDDLLAVLQSADVLLMPAQLPEGFPRSILEGMSCGLPIVATDAGGSREVFTPAESGELARDKSPEAIADALERLVRDADYRRRLGAAARREAAERYAPASHMAAILAIYRSVLGTREVAAGTGQVAIGASDQ